MEAMSKHNHDRWKFIWFNSDLNTTAYKFWVHDRVWQGSKHSRNLLIFSAGKQQYWNFETFFL